MNDERTPFALSCTQADAPAPVLTRVHAHGRLDAVLFELTLRQTYRNTSDKVLEVVYTFPLPTSAVLLSFASELNGARQEGRVVARKEAEQQYEESLEDGDAPVMLEALGDGLHTANIGNLKPGDELVLETRFGQLLNFEQGRLRLTIPTTIAPRFGNAGQAGLQAQQVPVQSLDAEHPLTLRVDIGEALSGATIACPTHRFATSHTKSGATHLELAPGASMDRDVVITVTPIEARPSLVVQSNNPFEAEAPVVTMAALQPATGTPRDAIALKLLVDCSGSMGGDSIASARAALRGVAAGLSERDHVSLSRFGSSTSHVLKPSRATTKALQSLQPLIDGIEADLGGTEMEAALDAVFRLKCGGDHRGGDVLLITDGEIWQADEMIAASRQSGHRIFAIGVGSAPAEGVLRALAEATGGACEFATPGEALEAAAHRMLHRMRQPVFTNVRMDWGHTPMWSTALPLSVFGGDTVIALAGFDRPTPQAALRLLAEDAQGHTVELARGEAESPCAGDSLARIAAARRLADMLRTHESDALALAVQYQLMSKLTHCILVHERAEADKASDPAALHQVTSMLAAGWGALGSVKELARSRSMPPMSAMAGGAPSAAGATFMSFDLAKPAPLSKKLAGAPAAATPATLEDMARFAGHHLLATRQVQGMAEQGEALSIQPEAHQALDELATTLGISRDLAWLLLAHWVNTRLDGLADANLSALFQRPVSAIDPALALAATRLLKRRLGRYPIDGWTASRVQRLRRALGRVGA